METRNVTTQLLLTKNLVVVTVLVHVSIENTQSLTKVA